MSYSFSVSSATRFDAVTQARTKFDEIVASQPAHAADRKAALASIEAFVSVLRQPGETEAVNISVSGSLSWQSQGEYTGASINVSAYIAKAD